MADSVSAATLVGAVLEQAGYISQSKLLDAFDGFFQSAGHLIYLIAVVGALTSVAVMGSAKLTRYFLIGPVIFWFLVTPRSAIEGVTWQIGEGEKKIGSTTATDIVDETTLKDDAPQIATVFKYYVEFVDTMVAESVKVITAQIGKKDAFFTDRATALHTIINAQMANPKLVGLYDNLLWGKGVTDPNSSSPCAQLMVRALAGVPSDLKQDSLEQFERSSALVGGGLALQGELTERVQKLHENREAFVTAYEKAEGAAKVQANASMREFLTEYKDNPTLQPLYQKAVQKSEPLECREVWNAIAAGVQMEAETLWEDIAEKYRGKWAQSDISEAELDRYEDDFCKDIAAKMGAPVGDGESCNLVPLVFISMMRNAATPNYLSRVLTRHKERGAFIEKASEGGVQPRGIDNPEEWQANLISGNPVVKYKKGDQFFTEDQIDPDNLGAYTKLYQFKKKDNSATDYFEGVELMDVDNQFDNAFNASLKFRLEGMRNELFAFAMELPYWQGVILYLIAFMYPLWALVVLVPGRAVNFFRLPLFWLWAKSWDVGFAFAMVFEQVLWNLLPQQFSAGEVLTPKSPEEITSLITFYADGLRLDPSYSIYSYYWALSLVVLSIPAITGSAILKGQRAALASFTDGAGKMPSTVGDRATSAYGMLKMNSHVLGARHAIGMEKLGVSPSSGSIGSWLAQGHLLPSAGYGGLSAAGQYFRGGAGAGGGMPSLGAAAIGTALTMQSVNGGGSNVGGAGGGVGGGVGNSGPTAPSSRVEMESALKGFVDGLGDDAKTALGYGMLYNMLSGAYGSLNYSPDVDLGGQVARRVGDSLYVSKGLKTMKEVFEKDIKFRGAFESQWGENGRYRGTYIDYEAIAAAMDPAGGFEMNDYTMNLVGEAVGSFQTQGKKLLEVMQHSLEGAIRRSGSFTPDIVDGSAVTLGLLWGTDAAIIKPIMKEMGISEDTSAHSLPEGEVTFDQDNKIVTRKALEDYYHLQLNREFSPSDVNILGNTFQSPVVIDTANYDPFAKYFSYDNQRAIDGVISDPQAEMHRAEQQVFYNYFLGAKESSLLDNISLFNAQPEVGGYQETHNAPVASSSEPGK